MQVDIAISVTLPTVAPVLTNLHVRSVIRPMGTF